MPNRLADETSPYLLQHADNPVEWYPWGDEAFARAAAEDRPVLLSVGYSSCHWCHVMAHESFEDEGTARLMNDWFVNIKVDREERPDIDGVYMAALQAMTGQGGWPMTVFLTPDRRPFYAGTYFPPRDGFGRPGFPRVLEALHDAWVNERPKLLASAEGIVDHLRASAGQRGAGTAVAVDAAVQRDAVEAFRGAFDSEWGGFGGPPKFPSPPNLEFLFAHLARTGDSGEPGLLTMLETTLIRMAQGGMCDQLGGGFSRYSVDARWLVPHFEKMLYDNAQLARTYLHAYQVTGDTFYARIARETLDYLAREMLDEGDGFWSAQDADSEGIEGKYYVWTPAEVADVLGDDADLFCAWYGVTDAGNFRDPHHEEFGSRSVLTTWADPEDIERRFGLGQEALFAKLDGLRARMLAERGKRVPPGLDDKVLVSWNGLALAAFAEAGRVLGEPRYIALAEANAAFVREAMWRDGRLLHTYKAGVAKVDGMLEDYAFYGLGLVELYRGTGKIAHLEWAWELLEAVIERFCDDAGGFFETPHDGEELLLRQKPTFDGPTPSGNAAAGQLAWWLGRYYDRRDWEALAAEVLAQSGGMLRQAPTGLGGSLLLAELMLAPRHELVLVGDAGPRARLERAAAETFAPWLVIAPGLEGDALPLFEGRSAPPGAAQAYFCEDMVCQLPVSDPAALGSQLGRAVARSD